MIHFDDNLDDEIFQTANNVDEDFFLATQLDELEHKLSQNKKLEEDEDLAVALKLDEELNSSFSNINRRSSSSSSRNAGLHSEPKGSIKTIDHNRNESDRLLALQLESEYRRSTVRGRSDVIDLGDIEKIETNHKDADYLLAVQLSAVNSPPSRKCEESGDVVKKYLNQEMSVVHPDWETIDPNPDIYALFLAYNKRFFYGKLDMVEVKWSPRMTLCAGICSYEQRAGHCTVKLSQPLLRLRPRKDLVETLLHEMIHAYLFVTNNNRDRDGHGPEFHSHMYRINRASGANITVYHSFHDEVKFYKNHEWRCNGVCRDRPPYYGYVRRSMNRAPGPSDIWYSDHRATCGGEFVKTEEPEDYGKKKRASEKKKVSQIQGKETKKAIPTFFKVPSTNTNIPKPNPLPAPDKTLMTVKSSSTANATPNTLLPNKKIFTLSDLAKKKRSPTKSPSGSPKKWKPLPGQRNILHFVNKS